MYWSQWRPDLRITAVLHFLCRVSTCHGPELVRHIWLVIFLHPNRCIGDESMVFGAPVRSPLFIAGFLLVVVVVPFLQSSLWPHCVRLYAPGGEFHHPRPDV